MHHGQERHRRASEWKCQSTVHEHSLSESNHKRHREKWHILAQHIAPVQLSRPRERVRGRWHRAMKAEKHKLNRIKCTSRQTNWRRKIRRHKEKSMNWRRASNEIIHRDVATAAQPISPSFFRYGPSHPGKIAIACRLRRYERQH